MIDIIVKVCRISPGRDKQHHQCIRLAAFLIALLHPGTDLSPIGRVTENFCPPQFCASPSISGVKYLGHFAFSGKAHGSRLKPNSASNLSKKSCGVAHTSFSEENNALFIMVASDMLCYTFASIELTRSTLRA